MIEPWRETEEVLTLVGLVCLWLSRLFSIFTITAHAWHTKRGRIATQGWA